MLFVLFWCLLALAKVALVAHNEIISIPYDSAVYASQSVGPWTLGAPQGYPIWLHFCQIFNVPQRIAIELLYLFSVLIMGYAGRKYLSALTGYLIVALLSFATYTYFLFDLGLTEGFFTALTLVAQGLTVCLCNVKSSSGVFLLSVALGGVFGEMAITRNEDPLLAFWVLLLIFGTAVLWRGSLSLRNPAAWKRPLLAGFIVITTACLIVSSLCLSYYFADGVFARGVALIPGHTKLLKNLSQIKTGQSQLRFVPISLKSRELAYAVSPTFAKLRPLVEDPADSWQVVSRQFGIPSGEIGGGWIWHAINSKVLAQSGGRSAVAEVQYQKMNAELQAAFDDGRLKRRFIFHPLLGGDIKGLTAALPSSISAVIESAFTSQPDGAVDQAFQPALFDKAFVRRTTLVPQEPELTVQGWAFINKPTRKIRSVVVSSDLVSSAPVISQERPDVVKVFGAQNGWRPQVVGFHANLKGHSTDGIKLTYILDDGTSLLEEHLKPAQMVKIENRAEPGNDILQYIDEADSSVQTGLDVRHNVQRRLYQNFQGKVIRYFALATFVVAFGLTSFALWRTKDKRWEAIVVFFCFVSLSWIGRILFYSLIDARAWPGDQIRYLAPAHAMASVMLAVSIGALVMLADKRADGGKDNNKVQAISLALKP